jgi:glycosyltransferase involved in cell wall biosynthesis
MPAKLFDYMAAGKPIISTNLKEVGDIIRSNDCGLVAENWAEFEVHLKRLYEDRALATKLGKNGRVAVEKYFNYELIAAMFLENLIEQFKKNITQKQPLVFKKSDSS